MTRASLLLLACCMFMACGTMTPADRFATTLSLTASGVVATDDALYAGTKVAADKIVADAKTFEEGQAKLLNLERVVTDVRAALAVLKGVLVIGLKVLTAVRAGGAKALVDAFIPTLQKALADVNQVLALLAAAGLDVPQLPTPSVNP